MFTELSTRIQMIWDRGYGWCSIGTSDDLPARVHLSQLWQQRDRVQAIGLRVKIVTFDDDIMAKNYIKQSPVNWPLLLDRDRQLYQAYGLPRGSWWDIYNPVSIARYLLMMGSGKLPGKPGSDWRQLGGDVLIDPAGIVRFHHVATSPHDRPEVDRVLKMRRIEQSLGTGQALQLLLGTRFNSRSGCIFNGVYPGCRDSL